MLESKAASMPSPVPTRVLHWMAATVLALIAATAALPAHAQEHRGPPPGMEGPGGAGPGMMMFGGPPEHAARAIDRMLDGLGVTEAQRQQVRQIAMAAAADGRAQREAGRKLRERGLQIFTAPTVDASAAEAIRVQMSAQQDQASKRRLQAMLDIANVLTPDQRARIGARIKERQMIMQDRMQRMQQEHGQRMAPPSPQK